MRGPGASDGSGDAAGAGNSGGSGGDGDPGSLGDPRTDEGGIGPPRPETALVSPSGSLIYIPIFSGDGDPVQVHADETFDLGVQQSFDFGVPAKLIDVTIGTKEPGKALLLTTPVPRPNMVECRPGVLVEPKPDGFHYLCTMGIRMSESAKPNFSYEGTIGLIFEATCTSRTVEPCDSLPATYSPAPDNPIDINFIATHWVAFEKIE